MARVEIKARTAVGWIDPWKGRWDLTLLWAEVDGRMECVGIEMYSTSRPWRLGGKWVADTLPGSRGPVPLTANILRALKIGQRVTKLRRGHRDVLRRIEETAPQDTAAQAGEELQLWTGRGRQPDYGIDHYQKVAQVYRDAWLQGKPPTKAVQSRFRVSYSYAAKKVQKARELGLLPPTTRGRASAAIRQRKGRRRG